jgi:hypothetical protein
MAVHDPPCPDLVAHVAREVTPDAEWNLQLFANRVVHEWGEENRAAIVDAIRTEHPDASELELRYLFGDR